MWRKIVKLGFIMGEVDIYYYSGTGNSMHIARELQKRIPKTNVIPITTVQKTIFIRTQNVRVAGYVKRFVYPERQK